MRGEGEGGGDYLVGRAALRDVGDLGAQEAEKALVEGGSRGHDGGGRGRGRGGSEGGGDSGGRVGGGGERERAAENGARHVFDPLPLNDDENVTTGRGVSCLT